MPAKISGVRTARHAPVSKRVDSNTSRQPDASTKAAETATAAGGAQARRLDVRVGRGRCAAQRWTVRRTPSDATKSPDAIVLAKPGTARPSTLWMVAPVQPARREVICEVFPYEAGTTCNQS